MVALPHFFNPYIRNLIVKTLIFQPWIILSNRIHRLQYQGSTTLGCKDIRIRVCDKDSIPSIQVFEALELL